jgi:hypothetical protein
MKCDLNCVLFADWPPSAILRRSLCYDCIMNSSDVTSMGSIRAYDYTRQQGFGEIKEK